MTSVEEVPDRIRMLFSEPTLSQLVWLRDTLDMDQRADRFLMAVLLGWLHRNATRSGVPAGLSVSMPNTFAMSPGYVKGYINERRLKPPTVDVLDFLEAKTQALELPPTSFVRGRAWQADATARTPWPQRIERAKLVLSSPPYLEVIKYGKFNWIRLWLLGADPTELDRQLFTSSSLDSYVAFMRLVIARAGSVLRDDGFICLVIGDVRRGDEDFNLARAVARRSVPSELRVLGLAADRLPTEHKVSRIWKENRGRATKTDRLLFLGKPDAHLRSLERISWS